MKKAVILDVDGVIIGEKNGFNLPHPHQDVMNKLCEVRENGIPIVLCTAKPAFAIGYEINEAGLENIHIADGGAVLIDNGNTVKKKIILEINTAKKIVETLMSKDIYTEVYTVNDYYLEKSQESKLTEGHAKILQKRPVIVNSIVELCDEVEVTKIAYAIPNIDYKHQVEDMLSLFEDVASIVWTAHPSLLPIQWGIITAPKISKAEAVIDVSKILGIPLENMLGVGDSTSDWSFMSLCGYAGAMGNASSELKELVKSKKHMVGKSVDENGVVEILDWYLKEVC